MRRALLALAGVIAALLLLEAGLRIAGAVVAPPIASAVVAHTAPSRILCVGDSSTQGVGASDRGKRSYPARLQEVLDRASPGGFEVVNLGIAGLNSSQLLNRFDALLALYEPQVVIAMIGVNDSWNLKESNVLAFYAGESPFVTWLLRANLHLSHLRIVQFTKLTYLSLTAPLAVTAPKYTAEARARGFAVSDRDPPRAAALTRALQHNVGELARIAVARAVPIVFMKYQVDGWGGAVPVVHRAYEEIAVPVVDNRTLFDEARQRKLPVMAADGFHPNDAGYELMARNVFNELARLRLVDAPAVPVF